MCVCVVQTVMATSVELSPAKLSTATKDSFHCSPSLQMMIEGGGLGGGTLYQSRRLYLIHYVEMEEDSVFICLPC